MMLPISPSMSYDFMMLNGLNISKILNKTYNIVIPTFLMYNGFDKKKYCELQRFDLKINFYNISLIMYL